ncbi:MAG: hypothetical protein LBQ15_06185 [Clostridium sp.]|jgi:acetyltransferase-like isoleucine patch superfamily enzyme|nr:hypothetical protein [Clostridium sp.]
MAAVLRSRIQSCPGAEQIPDPGSRGGGISIRRQRAFLKKCRITVIGSDNEIVFGDRNYLEGCRIFIKGSHNRVVLGDLVCAYSLTIHVEDDGNEVHIGHKVLFAGTTELACIEGTKIQVGSGCLFSSGVSVRTGDSHSIVSCQDGGRLNPSADIRICDRVWLGRNVTLLKGAFVPADVVVGEGSIVTQGLRTANTVVAGIPAKVIREGIRWCHERISS